ncbi:hypothetical protein GCM10009608_52470 [Pseudonocardia alaniniphila]
MGAAQRTGGEGAGGGGGAGANADGAGVVDGAGAAVARAGAGSFAGRGAATGGPGCGDVVSVQTATSAPTPTTAVTVASAARVRARTGESGRYSSIATDTAAQPKIASVAMTTAHRWDTRHSLCTAPSRRRTAFRSFCAEERITRQGVRSRTSPLFLRAAARGGTRSGPAEQVGSSPGSRSHTVKRTGWSGRILLIRFEADERASVMSISRTLCPRLASRG